MHTHLQAYSSSPSSHTPSPPSCGSLDTHTPRLFFPLTVMGPVEAAPEYRVIVDANNLTVEIENELSECPEGRAEMALPGVPHGPLQSPRRAEAGSWSPSPLASPGSCPQTPHLVQVQVRLL